jgi:hypothetical protein
MSFFAGTIANNDQPMVLPDWSQHLPADTRAKAVDLSRTGFADAAWPITSYREIVDTLRNAGFAILGGDILKGRRRDLEHTYDSWSSDVKPGEPWPAFVTRSCANATNYLAKLQKQPDLWFTVVVSARPSAAQSAKGHGR